MIFPYEKADPNAACRQQNGWSMQAMAVPEKIYGYVCLCEFLFTLIHAHKSLRAIEAWKSRSEKTFYTLYPLCTFAVNLHAEIMAVMRKLMMI